jgi:hypothetical protein
VGGLAIVVLALAGCGKPPQEASPKPLTVTVAAPEERAVLEYEDLPGRVAAIENVEVKAREPERSRCAPLCRMMTGACVSACSGHEKGVRT